MRKQKHLKVHVRVAKNGWGSILLPCCENAWRFCQLIKCNFLTTADVVHIQKLGFTFVIIEEIKILDKMHRVPPIKMCEKNESFVA